MAKPKVTLGKTQSGEIDRLHRLSFHMGEPSVFARNLRLLTVMRGLTAEEACKGIAEILRRDADAGLNQAWETTKDLDARQSATKKAQRIRKTKVDPKWYRRLMARGVSRSDSRTRQQFFAIARFFGVRHEGLWEPDLITVKVADLQAPILPPQNRFAIHAQKLFELLEYDGGRYDYLMPLLDSLHGEAFPPDKAGKPTRKAGAWTMPDED
jgi:hypothetical protein